MNEEKNELNLGKEVKENNNSEQEVPKKKSNLLHNEAFIGFVELIILAVVIIVGFSSGCIRCTMCGSDDNRLIIYASGISENEYKYKSCVGPAGILGFGINSKCWPTECMSVEYVDNDGTNVNGCVTYYNAMGCIEKAEVKSEGRYTNSLNCLSVSCLGNKYVETTAESTKATRKTQILGINCGKSEAVDPLYYNEKMPRQFIKGCWSSK